MPRKNQVAKPKSKHQLNSPTEPEPEAQLRESQISTQSHSDSNEEDLEPEAQLRESQISTQSNSDSDAVGPEPKGKSPIGLIEKSQDLLENLQKTLSTYVSTQEAESPTKDDDVEAEAESARASSDEDAQNQGQRQEEPLATEIQTSRTGAQMELNVEDDPLHIASDEVPQNPFQDPPMHLSQDEAIQSEESDPDDLDRGVKSMWFAKHEVSRETSQESDPDDLDRGGRPPDFFRNELFRKKIHDSTHPVANPNISPPAQSDPESALQALHSNTDNRPGSTESASSSSAPQYQKVQTTEMVRSETTRIIRSFQLEKIRIETVLKSDSDLQNLREEEEKLEDHETMLSNLIDELMIELKKTRGELKRISRRYRKAVADFEKASD